MKRPCGVGERGKNARAESLDSRMLLTAKLEGFVWVNSDGNGRQDMGDPGLNGVDVDRDLSRSLSPWATVGALEQVSEVSASLDHDNFLLDDLFPASGVNDLLNRS